MISLKIGMSLIFLLLSCESEQDDGFIQGLWSVVEGDSSYYEVIYGNGRYWLYSESQGEVMQHYKISKDSFFVTSPEGIPFIKSKISWINKDEFIAYDFYMFADSNRNKTAAHHKRIDISLDTASIFKGDGEVLSKYFEGLQERRQKWYYDKLK